MSEQLALAKISRHARRYAAAIFATGTLAGSHVASAEQAQAYLLFEIAVASDPSGTAERLRSTSLGNCLQVVIGSFARDVIVHLACDERGGGQVGTSYLNQAVLELSRVNGVAQSTVLMVRRVAQ
jgi:hypothetical protein